MLPQTQTKPNFYALLLSATVLAIAVSCPNAALAKDKLYSPYVEKGEVELEYFGRRSVDNDSGKNNDQKNAFSVGYTPNDWWKTELYATFEKEPGEDAKFAEWEWENIFQLTERGQYWLDVGASLAYEWTPQSNHADTIEARLLLAKDVGKTSHILNIIAEKDVGSGPKEELEGKLLWSSRYNYNSYFAPGFEISNDFGELENTGSFDEQGHYVGPAAYGKIPLQLTDHADALKYRVGYLFGVSDAASDGQAVLQLEYELHF